MLPCQGAFAMSRLRSPPGRHFPPTRRSTSPPGQLFSAATSDVRQAAWQPKERPIGYAAAQPRLSAWTSFVNSTMVNGVSGQTSCQVSAGSPKAAAWQPSATRSRCMKSAPAETVIAIMVAFEVAQRVSLYQSARLTDKRWREASTVVIAEAISDACKRGFSEVDFLRGDEDYKRNFTSERRQLVRLRAAAGWLGRSAMTTDIAASKAKALAVQAARRLRRTHR